MWFGQWFRHHWQDPEHATCNQNQSHSDAEFGVVVLALVCRVIGTRSRCWGSRLRGRNVTVEAPDVEWRRREQDEQDGEARVGAKQWLKGWVSG